MGVCRFPKYVLKAISFTELNHIFSQKFSGYIKTIAFTTKYMVLLFAISEGLGKCLNYIIDV